MSGDLFADLPDPRPATIVMAEGALILPDFLGGEAEAVLREVETVLAASPPRGMTTPGGQRMSVTTSSCGRAGWVGDVDGYRYAARDPATGKPWPPIPPRLLDLARRAAARAGHANFDADTCLINCYQPGARMGLHQDRNERDLATPSPAPIVSFSLGLPAVFLFGGPRRGDRVARHGLRHGDAAVWGGPSRLSFHGIAPLAEGAHPLLGRRRINLTLRKAL